ncbi:MAG: phospholipase D-like domain-containing protein [Arcicella sp.]|nr:phospholipase D-like domain-containing protein [Arcicella sp.]
MIKPHFQGIKTVLLHEIKQSKQTILIAVAWFTDKDVLALLTEKCSEGVRVSVIISNDGKNFNESYSVDFSDFKRAGGKLFVVDATFMHHKFTIIDESILVSGSANYTYNGFHKNNESIFVIDEAETIQDFTAEFERLIEPFKTEEGLIVSPMKQFLQNQIKLQQSQISWLSGSIAEIEKYIDLYEATYRVRFQAIIGEILWLQKTLLAQKAKIKEKPESKQQYQEAEQRWEAFKGAISEDAETIAKINDANLQEQMKALYREGVKLCHPDSPLVQAEFKAKAQQVFLKLKEAYDQNNLEDLQDILNELKMGVAFGNIAFESVLLDDLERYLEKLVGQVEVLNSQLLTLRNDERFLLQTGDLVLLQEHLAGEEVVLVERLRVLRGEVG